VFDATKEKMDNPMFFKLKPNQTANSTYFSDIFTDMDGRQCDNPYCTKLVIDPMDNIHPSSCQGEDMCDESAVPKTLAYVLID
jgi:hypothetical protein